MSRELTVELKGDHIVVTRPGTAFSATYHKPDKQPILRVLTSTLELDAKRAAIFQFRAEAYAVATLKARELGWDCVAPAKLAPGDSQGDSP
jgi:hypothetical protein